ncbi:MAG TPA: IPT/TIG domain-containing protein [Anaeromyxobacteraceae bacterium]|nr:IPT/TIG domain-containing protein [Anaeromyxobacteraceae bacterium]
MRPLARAAVACFALLAACGGGTTAPPSGPNPPLISSFSPTAGGVGTQVTIAGLLFAGTPAGNAVRFNGVSASVLSATTTSIVAVVPAGATTGRIQVTTAGGTATSASDFTVLSGPGSSWTTRLAGPRGRPTGLAFTGARYACVGDADPGFQASADGRVWTVTSQFSSADDVAWDGSLMVAVGSFWIYTSPDGLTWTMRTPPGPSSLRAVARSPAAWVGVGENGAAYSSADGLTWTSRTSGTTSALEGVAWTGSQLLAVGQAGAVTTSPDGSTWTPRTPPTTDSFTAVGASPSLAVATTSGSPSELLTTPDGSTWTPRLTGISPFNDVLYAGGRFVGVGFYTAATSPDGLTWDTTGTAPGIPESIVYTGAGYAAAGVDRNGDGAFFTSTDGLAWTLRAADQNLIALARRPSDGLLLAAGSDVARTSTDGGATWTLDLLVPSQNYPFLDLTWSSSAGAFMAEVLVGANQDLYRSSDGRGWTRVNYIPCYGGLSADDTGFLVAIGSSIANPCIATSDDDGVTWTPRTPPAGQPAGWLLRKAFWAGGQWVAVGSSGALATSPDGAAWTPRSSGVSVMLRGAAASPATLVVVGDGGTILTSPDGVTWTPRNSGTTYALRRVTWTGNEFLAAGSTGRLLRSADGVGWTALPTPWTASPNTFDLNDILALPGGHLVLAGDGGLVATSP